MLETIICQEKVVLLAERAMYWSSRSILFIADVHLGKIQHFRQAGIGVPSQAGDQNFERIAQLILRFPVKRIIFLGDLFHSKYNRDCDNFIEFSAQFSQVEFELVVGNHDILPKRKLETLFSAIYTDGVEMEPFFLTHIPERKTGLYNLAGHLHPGIRLRAPANQSLRLPCFHFQNEIGILPAFGEFTGLSMISKKKDDRIFGIYEDKVIEI